MATDGPLSGTHVFADSITRGAAALGLLSDEMEDIVIKIRALPKTQKEDLNDLTNGGFYELEDSYFVKGINPIRFSGEIDDTLVIHVKEI